MPELPEVETIRRELSAKIKGKTLVGFWSNWGKNTIPKPLVFSKQIRGKKITGADRRAKILILKLSDGRFIIIHLKLTGQLVYKPKTINQKLIYGGHPQKGGLDNLPNKFTHHLFTFRDGSKLFFNDLRKFGWVRLITKEQLAKLHDETGIEPFDKQFTFEKFKTTIKRYPDRMIKQVLLDQALIAGLGNIYADETLFAAGLRPTRRVKKIKPAELAKLYRAIKRILTKAIAYKGTSTDTVYIQLDGSPGGFGKFLKVYGRKNQKCKRCGTLITKIKLNGRGTHFCSQCQN